MRINYTLLYYLMDGLDKNWTKWLKINGKIMAKLSCYYQKSKPSVKEEKETKKVQKSSTKALTIN